MKKIGVDLKSLAPQLFPNDLPSGQMPPFLTQTPTFWNPSVTKLSADQQSMEIHSGFLAHLNTRKMRTADELSVHSKSALKTNVIDLIPKKVGSSSDPPFGRGILVSQTDSGQAIVSSVPAANAIYRDVYTSVFNRSYLLPFTFVVHSAQQDAFYFVKEETWKANDDKGNISTVLCELFLTDYARRSIKTSSRTSQHDIPRNSKGKRKRKQLFRRENPLFQRGHQLAIWYYGGKGEAKIVASRQAFGDQESVA